MKKIEFNMNGDQKNVSVSPFKSDKSDDITLGNIPISTGHTTGKLYNPKGSLKTLVCKMKKIEFNMYGDKKYVAVKDLKTSGYYAKSSIEGESKEVLQESIRINGVQKPIVINTFPGREGVIIDGNEVVAISKALGIHDIPCYDLYLTLEQEKEYHHLFAITCNEIPVEDIIAYLKSKPYQSYFQDVSEVPAMHDNIFTNAEQELRNNKDDVQQRKLSFLLRYDPSFQGYLDRLTKIIGAKSQNEALLTLVIEVVEGRLSL